MASDYYRAVASFESKKRAEGLAETIRAGYGARKPRKARVREVSIWGKRYYQVQERRSRKT